MKRSSLGAIVAVALAARAADAKMVNWRTRSAMPVSLTGLAAVDVSGTLYVFGGATDENANGLSKAMYAYSRVTDTWTTKTSAQIPRMAHSAAAVGATIFVIGGRANLDGAGSFGSTAFCSAYNTLYDTWTPIAALPSPREAACAAAVGGKVYVFGGFNTLAGTALSSVMCYDPATDSWSAKTAMPFSRYVGACAAPGDGNVYVFGGQIGGAPEVAAYNVAGDSWTAKAGEPTPRSEVMAVAVGNAIYTIGGAPSASPNGAIVEKYLYGSDTWVSAPPMGTARGFGGAVLHQGQIYVVGGTGTFPNGLSVVEEGWPGIDAAAATVAAATPVGTSYQLTFTLTNSGWGSPNNIQPAVDINTGAGLTTLFAGPSPVPPIGLAPGASQTFVWTYSSTGAGTVRFTLTATGFDPGSGLLWTDATTTQELLALPPGQPNLLTAVAGNGRVDIIWQPAAAGTYAISAYRIFRATTSPGSIAQVGWTGATATTFADLTALNGKLFYYKVQAADGSAPPLLSPLSTDLGATPFAPPGMPTGVTARAGNNAITVNWLPGAPGTYTAGNFHLYSRVGAGPYALLTSSLPSTATFYLDTSANNGTSYGYYLEQVDVNGHLSATSASASAIPFDVPSSVSFSTTAGNQLVIVSWNPAAATTYPLSGYAVYRGLTSGAETLLQSPVFSTSLFDAGVTNGTTYYYLVHARDNQGHESADLSEAIVLPKATHVNPPVDVTAVGSPTGIAVHWSPPAAGDPSTTGPLNFFRIYRATCTGCGYTLAGSTPPSGSWFTDDYPISHPGSYAYAVRAETIDSSQSPDLDGISLTGLIPNAVAVALAVTPASPVAGQDFTLEATVTNTGVSAASIEALNVIVDLGSAHVTSPGTWSPSIPSSLNPGLATTFSITYHAVSAGSVDFTLTATAKDLTLNVFMGAQGSVSFAIAAAPVAPATPATLETRVEAGKMLVGPNVLDHAAGSGIRMALRGTGGGHATIRIFDDGGRLVRTLTADLDGTGRVTVTFDGKTTAGDPLPPGLYHAVVDGGGVSDRRVFAVRGKKR